ncbi:aminoglycoside phosphotransferase family protein [Antribacter sp. KLBMP9083]|uniref:Aminoglycoside phosphotransferase family protein n=1 Tax=Antribacter soli TaxID=2910976 RepID=A0AA41QGF5_9MICO|nr:aminoglycoside phosphotransferase family protein [Antribacter soli]MCF4123010.1 aminoglycoside phosphotransferase family protein [Antribacter soli]
MTTPIANTTALDERQRGLLAAWLPNAVVVRDHSWGYDQTTVLEVATTDGGRFIVKAAGPADVKIGREIHAHQHWAHPWTSTGRAPVAVRHDADANLLLTRYLPGDLVLGTRHETDPDVYQQAGELLAVFHAQCALVDDQWEAAENARSLARLDRSHRLPADTVARLRDVVGSFETPPVTIVPTHGDWQPRNWLTDDGVVKVIDFGRAALRPAWTDLVRLAVKNFPGHRELETAFLDGYGRDPRDPDAWFRTLVREAIGTAVWGYEIGDESFERLGHRMVDDVLDEADQADQASMGRR